MKIVKRRTFLRTIGASVAATFVLPAILPEIVEANVTKSPILTLFRKQLRKLYVHTPQELAHTWLQIDSTFDTMHALWQEIYDIRRPPTKGDKQDWCKVTGVPETCRTICAPFPAQYPGDPPRHPFGYIRLEILPENHPRVRKFLRMEDKYRAEFAEERQKAAVQ